MKVLAGEDTGENDTGLQAMEVLNFADFGLLFGFLLSNFVDY